MSHDLENAALTALGELVGDLKQALSPALYEACLLYAQMYEATLED